MDGDHSTRVVPWTELDDWAGLAAVVEDDPDKLRKTSEAYPDGIWGIALLEAGVIRASAVAVSRASADENKFAIVRVHAQQGAALPLVRWGEEQAQRLGVERTEVCVRRAPGLDETLKGRGYQWVEAYLQMRQMGPKRAPDPLPGGFDEVGLGAIELDAFLDMSNRAFRTVPGAFDLTVADWKSITKEPGYRESLVRIVRSDSRPIAFLRGALDQSMLGEVDAIGVVAEHQGSGLGRYSLRRCEQLLREHGATSIELAVAATNKGAVHLYESEGFVISERRDAWERNL